MNHEAWCVDIPKLDPLMTLMLQDPNGVKMSPSSPEVATSKGFLGRVQDRTIILYNSKFALNNVQLKTLVIDAKNAELF